MKHHFLNSDKLKFENVIVFQIQDYISYNHFL